MARQKLGQHFLRDKKILRDIAELVKLGEEKTLVEIGPGHGELTGLIIRDRVRLIAVEKDVSLAEKLRVTFEKNKSFNLILGDIREELPELARNLAGQKWSLVGNIPYYLTGFLMRIIFNLANQPERCVFLIQKEVAERMCAQPPEMNKLAAIVQADYDPRIVLRVPRGSFQPQPEVESAVVHLRKKDAARKNRDPDQRKEFENTVALVFAQPRKTITNNLTAGAKQKFDRASIENHLATLGIKPQARPGDCSMENLMALARDRGQLGC